MAHPRLTEARQNLPPSRIAGKHDEICRGIPGDPGHFSEIRGFTNWNRMIGPEQETAANNCCRQS